MKTIMLIISILCGWLWLNIVFTEYINAKLNPYTEDIEKEKRIQSYKAKLKIALIIISTITFGVFIG